MLSIIIVILILFTALYLNVYLWIDNLLRRYVFIFLDRVMYARNQQYKYSKEPVTGGQPITVEQAKVRNLALSDTYTTICDIVIYFTQLIKLSIY